MLEITAEEAGRKSGGYPVWRKVIGPDNQPTGEMVHHESGQMAVVVAAGPVQAGATKTGWRRSHPDQSIPVGHRA